MALKLGMAVDLCMAYYADPRFDNLDLDTRSQWLGRGKQYLSYGIQTTHDGINVCMTDIYAHVRFDYLDHDFEFDFVRLVPLVSGSGCTKKGHFCIKAATCNTKKERCVCHKGTWGLGLLDCVKEGEGNMVCL